MINSDTLIVEKSVKAVQVIVECAFIVSHIVVVLVMLDSRFCYGWIGLNGNVVWFGYISVIVILYLLKSQTM